MAQDSLQFRSFLLNIANELTDANHESLTYLLEGELPAGKIEGLSKTQIISELQREGFIGPGDLGFLRQLLKSLRREDLVRKVERFCAPRLTPKPKNFVKKSGYGLRVHGGKHMVNDQGDEYVYVQSGQRYKLVIANYNSERCQCRVAIDGHIIFPGLIIEAGGEVSLDRPCHTASQFTSFAVKDAPPDSGIDERNVEDNGRIQVTFTPEVPKMTITFDVGDSRIHHTTCTVEMTDIEFHQMVSCRFGCPAATIIISGTCKLIGKRNLKLADYGIHDGSHLHINFGLVGGVAIPELIAKDPEPIPWTPAATTMQGESEQTFENVSDFCLNHAARKVVLHLRLVARADESPFPSASSEKCSPFVLGNRIPPPVWN